jgi:hypothetical protein
MMQNNRLLAMPIIRLAICAAPATVITMALTENSQKETEVPFSSDPVHVLE